MKKYHKKKHLSLNIASNEQWARFDHKTERSYRNTDDNWKENLNKLNLQQKNKLLFKYAYEGNLKMVKAILNSTGEIADINVFDKDNNNLLMYALKGGKKEVVKFLIENQINANYINIKGFSPLHFAVRKNRLDLVSILIDGGVDINIKDINGRKVVFDAVCENNFKMVCILSLNGCKVNTNDKIGITPLMVSTMENYRQNALFELLRLGADVNAVDNNGKNALMYAIKFDNRSAMDILLKNGTNLNHKDKFNNTAIMHCAKMGNREGVRVLIARGADILAKNIYGKTAYDIARENGANGCAEILAKAERIIKSNLRAEEKQQALKHFAKQNKVENSCAK